MKAETKALLDDLTSTAGTNNSYSGERYTNYLTAVLNDDVEFESVKARSGEIVSREEISPRNNLISVVKSVAKRATGMDDGDAALIDNAQFTKKEAKLVADAVNAADVDFIKRGNRLKFPATEDFALEVESTLVPDSDEVKPVYSIPRNPGEERQKLGEKRYVTKKHYAGRVRKQTPDWLKAVYDV